MKRAREETVEQNKIQHISPVVISLIDLSPRDSRLSILLAIKQKDIVPVDIIKKPLVHKGRLLLAYGDNLEKSFRYLMKTLEQKTNLLWVMHGGNKYEQPEWETFDFVPCIPKRVKGPIDYHISPHPTYAHELWLFQFKEIRFHNMAGFNNDGRGADWTPIELDYHKHFTIKKEMIQ